MTYLWIKAAHVVAVITWMGGMLVTSVTAAPFRGATQPLPPQTAETVAALRAWDRRVTTPAMLLTWVLGLTLASLGGWFPAHWLLAKLAVVVALSGLHGAQAGGLRRAAGGGRLLGHFAGFAVIALFAAIVVLVIVKPF